MPEIKQDQIPGIIEKFPLVEDVINEVRKNSTYGKFCMPYVIIDETRSLNDTDHKLFTFIFRMQVEVDLKPRGSHRFIVEWSHRYYYYELEMASTFVSHDIDRAILKNVSDIISSHIDIDRVTFKVNNEPYKMAWEIGV